jgi:hypothetical protein
MGSMQLPDGQGMPDIGQLVSNVLSSMGVNPQAAQSGESPVQVDVAVVIPLLSPHLTSFPRPLTTHNPLLICPLICPFRCRMRRSWQRPVAVAVARRRLPPVALARRRA